jgi:hypothetical protein
MECKHLSLTRVLVRRRSLNRLREFRRGPLNHPGRPTISTQRSPKRGSRPAPPYYGKAGAAPGGSAKKGEQKEKPN